MEIKLPFGLRDNKPIHISEISDQEKGLKCNCICPQCGQRLIARLGNKKVRHFAHHNENCEKAFQTALHIFAKEVLKKNMRIRLPELKLRYNTCYKSIEDFGKSPYELYDYDYFDEEAYENKLIVKECDLYFDRISIEQRIDNIISDIVVYKNEVPLLIEVAVTHFIDEAKLKRIRELKISTIEIDLNIDDIDYYKFDRNVIEKIIIEETKQKIWIYNRKEEETKKKILDENKIIMEQEKRREEERIKFYEKEKLKEKKKMELKQRKLKEITQNYESKVKEFEENFNKNKLWVELSNRLKIKALNIPEFLNCRVPGELSFECDRRIWQSYIFEKFVLNRKGKSVKVCNVVRWVKKYSPLPVNKELEYTKDLDNEKIPDLTDAILEYLLILNKYGFLQKESYSKNFYTSFSILYDKLDVPVKSKEEIEGEQLIKELLDKTKEQVASTIERKRIEPTKYITIYDRVGICRLCGKATNDWSIYYGEDKTCICKQCNLKREY